MMAIDSTAYIHPTAFVEDRVQVGPDSKVWVFSHLMEGCIIGKHCSIGAYCQIDRGVTISDNTRIGNGVWVFKGVEFVGRNVFVGPGVRFTNDKYPSNNKQHWKPELTYIEDDVSIGAGAIILPGIKLSYGCRIAAGAIVTKDVAPLQLVKGKW